MGERRKKGMKERKKEEMENRITFFFLRELNGRKEVMKGGCKDKKKREE